MACGSPWEMIVRLTSVVSLEANEILALEERKSRVSRSGE